MPTVPTTWPRSFEWKRPPIAWPVSGGDAPQALADFCAAVPGEYEMRRAAGVKPQIQRPSCDLIVFRGPSVMVRPARSTVTVIGLPSLRGSARERIEGRDVLSVHGDDLVAGLKSGRRRRRLRRHGGDLRRRGIRRRAGGEHGEEDHERDEDVRERARPR